VIVSSKEGGGDLLRKRVRIMGLYRLLVLGLGRVEGSGSGALKSVTLVKLVKLVKATVGGLGRVYFRVTMLDMGPSSLQLPATLHFRSMVNSYASIFLPGHAV
jgi:hypothetical protein